MKHVEHTPGPWFAVSEGDIDAADERAGGSLSIATVIEAHSDAELRANQNLIAAAPDLLLAARWAYLALATSHCTKGEVDEDGCRCDGCRAYTELRLAINKADAPVEEPAF